jgi:tetratricopeptide (TPR) repeat protein
VRKFPASYLPLVLVSISFFFGCSRDPNVGKQKYFERGQRYFAAGKFDEAGIEFRNALAVDPAYADAHYQLARAFLYTQQWLRAGQELGRTLQLQPENYSARLDLAKLLIASGDLQPAKQQIDWLLQNRPTDAESHSAAADLCAADNDFPSALQEATKAVELNSTEGSLYAKLALIQLKNSQADRAEINFHKAIELDPKSVAPRLMLANYYEVRRRFREAEAQLRESIRTNPENPEPTAALARLYLDEGKKPEAESLLIQAKRGFADNSAGYRLLGDFYLGMGDLGDATNEYRTLYQEHPKDLQVKKNFTDLLIHTNRFEQASAVDDEILQADPSDSDGLIYRGQICLRSGDASAAVSTLQTVIKNDPNNGMAHYQLGLAFQKTGILESAETEWRDAVRLRSDLVAAQRELALLAMRKGDMATLEQASTQLIGLRPASPDGYALRAVSEINRQLFPAAESDARQAVRVSPTSSAGYVQLGNVNFAQMRFNEAETSFRQALARDPKSNDALRGLLNTYVAMKQTDKAITAANLQISQVADNSGFYDLLGTLWFQQKKDLVAAQAALEKSIALDKKNTDAIIKLGQVEAANGHMDDAIAVYQQAAKDNPQEASLYVLLGQFYQSRQDWAKAEDSYQKALTIRHEDPIASCNLAYVMLRRGGDLDIALSLAQSARRRLPDSADVADTLGWIYYQKGAYYSAIDTLQSALALSHQNEIPDSPRYHYHLGMAYAKSGKLTNAREELQKMLRMSPESSDADEARKQLSQLES